MQVDASLLAAIGAAEPKTWAPLLSASCAKHGIKTPRRFAAFLANNRVGAAVFAGVALHFFVVST